MYVAYATLIVGSQCAWIHGAVGDSLSTAYAPLFDVTKVFEVRTHWSGLLR